MAEKSSSANEQFERALKNAILKGELGTFLREKCFIVSSHPDKNTVKIVADSLSKIYLESLELLVHQSVNWLTSTDCDLKAYIKMVSRHEMFRDSKGSQRQINTWVAKFNAYFGEASNLKRLYEVIVKQLKHLR